MSESFVYTALKTTSRDRAELNGHITTSFMKVSGKMPKLQTCVNESIAEVVDVKYLPGGDVTVAVVDCCLASARRECFELVGLTYDYEFIPHITICRGDFTSDYKHLLGEKVHCGGEYIGFICK